jgi:ribonucleotide reductase beta subunit family protein with ferritin-like domain
MGSYLNGTGFSQFKLLKIRDLTQGIVKIIRKIGRDKSLNVICRFCVKSRSK